MCGPASSGGGSGGPPPTTPERNSPLQPQKDTPSLRSLSEPASATEGYAFSERACFRRKMMPSSRSLRSLARSTARFRRRRRKPLRCARRACLLLPQNDTFFALASLARSAARFRRRRRTPLRCARFAVVPPTPERRSPLLPQTASAAMVCRPGGLFYALASLARTAAP
jgi:hypothetical protein